MKSKKFGFAHSRKNHHEKKFYNWEFEDDERQMIREWSKKRIKKMHGLRRSYQGLLVYSFHMDTIKSFIQNFNLIVLMQMLIAGVSVYFSKVYNISFEFNVALVVSPIVFPLAFSINTDFQRREKVLEDLANFKSSAMVFFFCIREWRTTAELDTQWLNAVQKKIHSVMFNLREYLLTERVDRRNIIARYMYEDFSDTSQLIEEVRSSALPANTALVGRGIHLLNQMCLSFERLRVIREYRSPRSIRAFNKVLIFLLPIILSPYFVSLSKKDTDSVAWSPYVIAVMVAGVFGALQGVQDKLDDPFDGMSEDDINLDTIDEWTFMSLDTAACRNLVIGRFHVSKNVDDLETAAVQRKGLAEYMHTMQEAQNDLEGEDVDSSVASVGKKGLFSKRKSAKSTFRRSVKKEGSFNRRKSMNFTDASPSQGRRDRSSISSHTFSPERHPFAEVLETMTGDTTITRKDQMRLQRTVSFSTRQNSADEEAHGNGDDCVGVGCNKVYKPNYQPKHSIVSIIKEIPFDDDATIQNNSNSTSTGSNVGGGPNIPQAHCRAKTESESSHSQKIVSYADEPKDDLTTARATIIQDDSQVPRQKELVSGSLSSQPLLSNMSPPDTPITMSPPYTPLIPNSNRFKVKSLSAKPNDSIELKNITIDNGTMKSNSRDCHHDDELQQVLVVNDNKDPYNGSHHSDVLS